VRIVLFATRIEFTVARYMLPTQFEHEIRGPRAAAVKIELPGINDLHLHAPIVFLVVGTGSPFGVTQGRPVEGADL
jgi:hypothetical protein